MSVIIVQVAALSAAHLSKLRERKMRLKNGVVELLERTSTKAVAWHIDRSHYLENPFLKKYLTEEAVSQKPSNDSNQIKMDLSKNIFLANLFTTTQRTTTLSFTGGDFINFPVSTDTVNQKSTTPKTQENPVSHYLGKFPVVLLKPEEIKR